MDIIVPQACETPAALPVTQKYDGLHVRLFRAMWSDYFTLVLDNGQSEELEPEELREWFRSRGADMAKMEKVFDTTWNFGRAEVVIKNPKEPKVTKLPYAPDI